MEEALQRLKDGNLRFVENRPERPNQDPGRMKDLYGGQNPFAVVLSCADSRVVPEIIFDTGLGDLFVVRVAGNVANVSSVASIEYAVANLNPEIILVLAHENCGAVTAALSKPDAGNNIDHLLSHIGPANEAEQGEEVNEVARKNALHTVTELKRRSRIIREALNEGRLGLVPAYYQLSDGKVVFI